jgi:hypothetical protein
LTTVRLPHRDCYEITGTTPQTTIAVTVWLVFIDDWLAAHRPERPGNDERPPLPRGGRSF